MWRHTVQHEMLHALGFLHEMARPDRDDYVVVHWDNIDPIFHNQYHKMNNLTWEDYGEKYDLKSIMHYEGWAFAKAGFHKVEHNWILSVAPIKIFKSKKLLIMVNLQ